jgi:hypothetical protein
MWLLSASVLACTRTAFPTVLTRTDLPIGLGELAFITVVADIVNLDEAVPGFIVFAVMFAFAVLLAAGFGYALCSGVRRERRGSSDSA